MMKKNMNKASRTEKKEDLQKAVSAAKEEWKTASNDRKKKLDEQIVELESLIEDD